MNTATELRTAAAKLRTAAEKATPGPWLSGVRSWAGDGAVLNCNGHPIAVCGAEIEDAEHPASADAAWMALVSPVLAEPLAAWLESWDGIEVREDGPMVDDYRHALAVARAINAPREDNR